MDGVVVLGELTPLVGQGGRQGERGLNWSRDYLKAWGRRGLLVPCSGCWGKSAFEKEVLVIKEHIWGDH